MYKYIAWLRRIILLVLWLVYQVGQFPAWCVLEAIKFSIEIITGSYKVLYPLLHTEIHLPKIDTTPLTKTRTVKLPKVDLPKVTITLPPVGLYWRQGSQTINRLWQRFLNLPIPLPRWPKINLPSFQHKTVTIATPKVNLKLFRAKPARRGRPPKKRGLRKWLDVSPRVRWSVAAMALLVMISGYTFILVTITRDLPSPDKLSSLDNPTTTEFYDRNGQLLYQLYEGRNRTLVNLDQVPQNLVNATVAIEDKHFFSHHGVDLMGVARAVLVYFRDHEVQGGSTLTQQLIKNTLLTTDRTWQRKAKEMVLAVWAERIYSKDQILQMYFNESPYGGPAWGVEAAAETYFKKDVKDLDLAESAYLAGLPASPTTFSPFGTNPELGVARQHEVLAAMLEQKYISKEQYDKAMGEELTFAPAVTSIKAPHFVMYLRSLLAQKYGERTLSQGGLKIQTTLDLKTQQMAEQVVAEEVDKLAPLNVTNGAAMVMDPKNGQILAMVGSKNYFDPKIGNFNVAIAPRQPGSSIKPITYATGFKQGYTPGTIMLDTATTFKNAWESYSPVNYDGKFHGPVTVRTALGSSYNIPAVKMLAMVGIPNMIQTAKDLGITTFEDPSRFGLSLTLGGGEVKLIDLTGAYATFADGGVHHDPEGVLKITDSHGNVLEDNTNSAGTPALSPGVAYLISNVLADNNARTPAFGPNSLLKIPGHTVAVKTGTTDLKRDNWTFGYTPDVVVGVWVGNNDNTPMDPRLSSGVTGAAPIWNRIITNLVADQADVAFNRPAEVIDGSVDGRRDLVLAGLTNKSAVASKKGKDDQQKDQVTFTDPFNSKVLIPVSVTTP